MATELARLVQEEVPAGDLSWVSHEFSVRAAESLEHSHEFAFVYAKDGTIAVGERIGLAENGARIAGVSGIFGGGDDHSHWGANNAIDGEPPETQWSSDGDGKGVWIEIELPSQTHVTSIGFWTRTMGPSAQIYPFQVVVDGGHVYGPLRIRDAAIVHYFDSDLTARRLIFEAVETSGGNTGAVEIEVYGYPISLAVVGRFHRLLTRYHTRSPCVRRPYGPRRPSELPR